MMDEDRSKKVKKHVLYSIIILIGCIAVYFVFSGDNSNNGGDALNTELPDAAKEELPTKNDAYIADELSNLSPRKVKT